MLTALPSLRFVAVVLWGVGVQTHEFVATVGFALLLASYALPPGWRDTRRLLRVYWPLVAFFAWVALAPFFGGSVPTGTGVARWFDWFGVPFVAHATASFDRRQWQILATATLATLVISCTAAGLQHFGAWPSEHFFEPFRWTRTQFRRVYEGIPGTTRHMAGGLLFHRLKFSHVTALGVLAALLTARHARGRHRKFAVLAALIGFLSVWLFPYARMGALALTVGASAFVFFTMRSKRRALAVIAGLSIAGVVVLATVAPLRQRFVAGISESRGGLRSEHLQSAGRAIEAHPLVGVGAGQFTPSKFEIPDMSKYVRAHPGKAHNQFVSVAAEAGIPGALAFVALLLWIAASAQGRPLAPLAWSSLTFFAVLSLAHDPLFHAEFSLALVLCLGIGLSEARALRSRAPRTRRRLERAVPQKVLSPRRRRSTTNGRKKRPSPGASVLRPWGSL